MALPAPSPPPDSAPVSRWRGRLPDDLVDGLIARPAAARAFERLSLAEIRELVRWIQAVPERQRMIRLRQTLAELARGSRAAVG